VDPIAAMRRLRSSPLLQRVVAACGDVDVFLTGGSLRDRFLGLATHDLDLVVPADAAAVAGALAAAFGGSRFTLGRPPDASQRVTAGSLQIDLWEARGALRDDILRRDFTVNALFWRLPRGPLIDLVNGVEDLAAGRIRVVRPENLADDPLRVLRGIRLLATRPQLKLTAETEGHLAAAAGGLTRVARERVLDELRRLLAGPEVDRALLAAVRLGLLTPLASAWKDYPHATAAARIARELTGLADSRWRRLGAAAPDVALALLAAPAAGFPESWRIGDAVAALIGFGLGRSAARRIATAVELGERLRRELGRDRRAERELAVEGAGLLPAALAWATARTAVEGADLLPAARRLLRWQREFEQRPPLLTGEEIAALLELPPDARRAAAATALRRAQARGDARNRRQAIAFLRARRDR
jgi:tRNA nucleotidyltransferase/poly(A) polymerase